MSVFALPVGEVARLLGVSGSRIDGLKLSLDGAYVEVRTADVDDRPMHVPGGAAETPALPKVELIDRPFMGQRLFFGGEDPTEIALS